MKIILAAILFFSTTPSFSQYYYKDIIGTRETAELIATYRNNKVNRVQVNSYDANNVRLDNIIVQQQFSPVQLSLITVSKSFNTNPSILTAFVNEAGKVIKTVDSSNTSVNRAHYTYDAAGNLISIISTSADTSKKLNETEEHLWKYNGNKVARMYRIKNKVDTTYVDFKLDENGNVAEEHATRKGKKSEPVYYYYDENNRLTDIVRYNNKANRLLPEYMFEYSPSNHIIQRITVPGNGSDYIIWRSQFDQRGLKTKEAIYNKYKELTGKIEYQYSFGS